MGCLVAALSFAFTYLITAAIVKVASIICGFAFSWGLAFGATLIFILLKTLLEFFD